MSGVETEASDPPSTGAPNERAWPSAPRVDLSGPVTVSDAQLAVSALFDDLIEMVAVGDESLVDALWGDGELVMIGLGPAGVRRSRAELATGLDAILAQGERLSFDFPNRRIIAAGSLAWLFAEGVVSRGHPDGTVHVGAYVASCIFERAGGRWRWRQFLGSEVPHPEGSGQ
jgi:ketosteroid isomerase-like protein